MKKLVVAGCAALALCAGNAETDTGAGASLTVNQVRQRYPWNGLVDIDYTIECAEGAFGVDDNLEVLMIDNSVTPAVTNRAITFLQAPLPMTPGKHRITWDANADGVTTYVENATFRVKITHYNETYMVIDVSGGPNASVYPVKFMNAAPIGGFNKDEDKGKYKGSNIVLRCIHPGSYMAGSPANEANRTDTAAREKQHRVALSQPFYIGIYEITQEQYKNVTGADPSTHKGDYRPVEKVSYSTIRGTTDTSDTSKHTYDWPWNDNVAPTSFMGLLRAKCKAKGGDGNYTEPVDGFDLPTEFQWEYACRAGTTGALNTTNAYNNANSGEQEAQLRLQGRYTSNQTDGKGGYDANHTNVGSYQPNQWGLYDMHGNVWEWCRDWYQEDATSLKQFTDPKGAASGSVRVRRGGGWNSIGGNCRSATRYSTAPSSASADYGFRLSRSLP